MATLAAQTPGMLALAKSYGAGRNFTEYFDQHVEALRQSDNGVVARCGEVWFQVGVGYRTGISVAPALVALGQGVLGTPVGVAAAAVNPVAMTCGAIGALYYGRGALKDDEKQTLLAAVAKAFELGAELLRSLIGFALSTLRELLSKENLKALRRYVSDAAESVGRSFADVTRRLSDRLHEGLATLGRRAPALPIRPSPRSKDVS